MARFDSSCKDLESKFGFVSDEQFAVTANKKQTKHIQKNIVNINTYWKLDEEGILKNFKAFLPEDVLNSVKNPKALDLYNKWGDCDDMYREYELKVRAEIESRTMSCNVYSNEECVKCHKKQVISYEKQMRRADEPATIFKVCFNCNYTSRH